MERRAGTPAALHFRVDSRAITQIELFTHGIRISKHPYVPLIHFVCFLRPLSPGTQGG